MASACCLGAETCFRNSRPTCSNLCEPGGAGVKVDGLEADHLARLAGLADGHTHQRILLLRDHQHLKHFQWTGKGEVEVLQQKEDREGFASVEFWCVLCCFIPQGRASCSISALSPIKQSTGTWIIGISEYRSNGHFYLDFKMELQTCVEGHLSLRRTLISINLCMGSYHCNKTIPDCSAPHRYLWPVYGFLTEK